MLNRPIFAVLFAIPILVAVIVVFASDCFGSGGESEEAQAPTPEPTEAPVGSGPAEQALARYVETTLGKKFVEDCSKADSSRDVGKVCSVLRGEREGLRAYSLGLTFSEGLQWAILGQTGGQWQVVHNVPLTSTNAGVPGIPWPLRTGVDLVVVGAAPCVNVREGPALSQRAVDCIADGTRVRLTAGPSQGDNFQWWQVEGRTGWVVADYLRYPDAAR